MSRSPPRRRGSRELPKGKAPQYRQHADGPGQLGGTDPELRSRRARGTPAVEGIRDGYPGVR